MAGYSREDSVRFKNALYLLNKWGLLLSLRRYLILSLAGIKAGRPFSFRQLPESRGVSRIFEVLPFVAFGEVGMNHIRMHLIIDGRVQGVWFRESTRREAISLKLTGWVRNRPDGTVEAVIEGPEHEVNRLVSWCHKGPPAARVTGIRKDQDTWQGEFDSFDIVF